MRLFKHNNPEYQIKILDYTYTNEPSINNALPLLRNTTKLVFFIIACLLSSGFLWLVAKWSSKKKAILLYDVCHIDEATHFLIIEEDVVGGSTIVERLDKYDIKRKEKSVGFCYHERVYLYHHEKEVLLPIRYEQLGIQLDKLKKGKYQPYIPKSRKKLLDYYGMNEISLPVQSKLEVFIQEMLTPYQVFQLYAIILWIYEEYYIFSFILLGYSIYTYWGTSDEVVLNQQKLSQQSYFNFNCKIVVKDHASFLAISKEDSDDQTIMEDINTNRASDIDENFIKMNEQEEGIIKEEREGTMGDAKKKSQDQLIMMTEMRSSVISNKIDSGFEAVEISSRDLLPGDLIILKQGDTCPCDCLILSGQALADEQYITGESFLRRKSQLRGFTYSKEKQHNFLLYLGTKIIKVKKSHSFKPDDDSHMERIIQQNLSQNNSSYFGHLLGPKELICIVSQTNYNTQRGKYLRAVRYQKKPTQNFTKETIYFIYIIMGITTFVFLLLLPIISENNSKFTLFILYLDLLAVSIPMTLPTALSVGIGFAQHRLANSGIHSVLPSNILAGGRATSIVLDSNKIFGKKYEMESMMVGMKGDRRMGTTYSSLRQFLDLNNNNSLTESFFKDPIAKRADMDNMSKSGKMLLRAFSSCHTLEYYNNQITGTIEDRQIFSFAEAEHMDEDVYRCLNETLHIKERIFFKEKDKKLAVICEIVSQKPFSASSIVEECRDSFSVMHELSEKPKMEEHGEHGEHQESPLKMGSLEEVEDKSFLFIKGPSEKILPLCLKESYPANCLDYVVDMAEKGFKIICYAYKPIQSEFDSEKDIKQLREEFIFCGFAILETEQNQQTQNSIKNLRKSKIQMILISEDRELQASSVAIHNKFCSKNELLLCSLKRGQILCRGHIQWESSGGGVGDGDQITEFMHESEDFVKKSYLSLNSKLYEELFMKRQNAFCDKIFNKTIILNEMENRHSRNLYLQLEKRDLVSFAVGSGGSVSECAHLSLEMERGECSLLSSFHTQSKSLNSITECLIICRAALATNFHCFSMMVLFSLVQFTTVSLLYQHYQIITDDQMLYQDLFVTFPIFITINLTKPVTKLSKELPPNSFFSPRALASMIGQLLIQFLAQLGFIMYLFSVQYFQREKEVSYANFLQNGEFNATGVSLATFILTNYLYLGIVLSTSVSKPFRKPFYTNPYYTLTLVILWLYNTAIVLIPSIAPGSIRRTDLDKEVEYFLVIAMLLGNLIMILMYLYENLLVWIWDVMKKVRKGQAIDEINPGE